MNQSSFIYEVKLYLILNFVTIVYIFLLLKMAFRALFSVCLIAVAVAVPSDLLRAVPNPKTPNQILDRVAEDAVKIMT